MVQALLDTKVANHTRLWFIQFVSKAVGAQAHADGAPPNSRRSTSYPKQMVHHGSRRPTNMHTWNVSLPSSGRIGDAGS